MSVLQTFSTEQDKYDHSHFTEGGREGLCLKPGKTDQKHWCCDSRLCCFWKMVTGFIRVGLLLRVCSAGQCQGLFVTALEALFKAFRDPQLVAPSDPGWMPVGKRKLCSKVLLFLAQGPEADQAKTGSIQICPLTAG